MASARELDPGASTLAFFGAELRRHRIAAGLSQDDLGRAINFSGALVGRVEMAERMPSQDFADRCDEVRRPVGGPETMREQLKRLIEATNSTNVVLQVLPLTDTEHHSADGALTILEPTDGPPVAYAEGWRSGRMIESAAEVADAIMVFDLIRAAALPRGASLDLIRSVDFGP